MTLERLILVRLVPWAIIAIAIGSLTTAMIAEHYFKLEPCILCLYQRLPYVATALLALLALKLPQRSPAIPVIIVLCGLVYLAGAAVAVYHTGVEQHWWISGCTGVPVGELSFDQMRTGLTSKPAKSCDDVDWTLFGISMATYNAAYSIVLGLASLMAARLIWKNNEPKKDSA